ncbi:MAG: calcium-binding protein [Xenococcaceae cyanobacterium MO_234.B1]|nr:calcium-binding protein [Xenococcaceae cyanobacterium MO_234.B1]
MAYRRGSESNDTLPGTNESDTILGFQGDDWLVGNNGNDNLHGHSDNDRLFGGIGSDTLDGGTGNDTLVGFEPGERDSSGVDILRGGRGSDKFFLAFGNELYYDDGSGHAQIKDFNPQEDKLVLLGSASDYEIETFGGINSFIFTQGQEDFIAVVEEVSNFNLNADYVQY